jgi:putative addiction module component (TIGR02574 family)
MTRAVASLLRDALDLSEAERIDLASELLASVDGPADADWDDAWAAELDRRADEADGSGDHGDSWADVRARIREHKPDLRT